MVHIESHGIQLLRPAGVRTTLVIVLAIFVSVWPSSVRCQQIAPSAPEDRSLVELKQQIRDLCTTVEGLKKRVNELERQARAPQNNGPAAAGTGAPQSVHGPRSSADTAQGSYAQPSGAQSSTSAGDLPFLPGTTVNFLLDGYYGYNFNAPIGRVNLLRAYDVSSNAFSLNQAAVVLENAPDPAKGKRFGLRLDLQYGQATATLQGNPANELRPEIYRNIFQAYGTYVVPVGSGLNVDFGKWASSLGMENNYTKDQMNYSRSYWFTFLPYYHMGVRAHYQITRWLGANYWSVNGTQQTEAFNAFKDQLFGVNIQPRKNISWTINYYLGQEHPDVVFYPNAGAPPNLPAEQGMPFAPIRPALNGKLNILDNYVTWQLSPKLTIALEGDYVIQRQHTYSAPAHTDGGAVYVQRQITPKLGIAARAEYLLDRGGLFSGITQALKEGTLTATYQFAGGFQLKGEYRRDFSNRPFFLTSALGVLAREQSTAEVGLIWWWGGKEGAW